MLLLVSYVPLAPLVWSIDVVAVIDTHDDPSIFTFYRTEEAYKGRFQFILLVAATFLVAFFKTFSSKTPVLKLPEHECCTSNYKGLFRSPLTHYSMSQSRKK